MEALGACSEFSAATPPLEHQPRGAGGPRKEGFQQGMDGVGVAQEMSLESARD